MNTLMNKFSMIKQDMNEKKNIIVKSYPEKAIEVERRVTSRMVVTPGQ